MAAESTPNDMMAAYAEDAVEMAAQDFQIALDYSEASLESVEQILAVYYEAGQALLDNQPVREDMLLYMQKVWGGYIGEVIRRHWGGDWDFETAISKEPMLTLHVRGVDLWPHGKVYKRLTNGEEDNIWFYYYALTRNWQSDGSTEGVEQ